MTSKKTILLYKPKALFYDRPLTLIAVKSILNRNKYDIKIIGAQVDKDVESLTKKYATYLGTATLLIKKFFFKISQKLS